MTIKRTLSIIALAAIGFSSCENKQTAPTGNLKTVSLDEDALSYAKAKEYVKNYEKHAGYVVDSTVTGFEKKPKKLPNARCVWFDIDKLDALVQKIKAEKGDGIRFYLATYNMKYDTIKDKRAPKKEYWGYNTLVMVSTKDSLNGVYHQDYYNNKPATANGVGGGTILGTTPENRGEMCPPPKNCPSVGATLIP